MESKTHDITPLITREAIQKRVRVLGESISQDFTNEEITLICVLDGAFIFTADLIRSIAIPLRMEFIKCSSYGNATQTSGNVHIQFMPATDIEGKNVVVVEDIVDTGLTLKAVLAALKDKKPKSLKVAGLLSKPSRRKTDITIHYQGFEVQNEFVVGYGMDYAGLFRNLPYIGICRHD